MRPHSRAASPRVRCSWRPTRLALGGLTSLTAVSLVGVLGALPAAAQGLGAEALPTPTVMSTDQAFSLDDPDLAVDPAVDPAADLGRPGKPKPPRPGANVFDIDTVRQEAGGGGAFYAAVSFRNPLRRRRVRSWRGHRLGRPLRRAGSGTRGCLRCVHRRRPRRRPGSTIFIDVITTSGTVHGITCARTGSVVTSCGTWVQRATPTPGDTLTP